MFSGQLTYTLQYFTIVSQPSKQCPRYPRPLVFLFFSSRPSYHEDSHQRGGGSSLLVQPFQAHQVYQSANDTSETLKGGAIGGTVGLALGVGGVFAAARRYPAFRQLTLPLRAFLCTSSATFGGTWDLFQ